MLPRNATGAQCGINANDKSSYDLDADRPIYSRQPLEKKGGERHVSQSRQYAEHDGAFSPTNGTARVLCDAWPQSPSLSLHGRGGRVFDLNPAIGAADAIRRAKSLGHDTLAAERAGLAEDNSAFGIESRLKTMPGCARRNSPLRVRLRTPMGSRPSNLARPANTVIALWEDKGNDSPVVPVRELIGERQSHH